VRVPPNPEKLILSRVPHVTVTHDAVSPVMVSEGVRLITTAPVSVTPDPVGDESVIAGVVVSLRIERTSHVELRAASLVDPLKT
jgi:hypothetical protein